MLSEQSRWFLSKLTRTSPFQPATNYWRSIELCEFLARPFPQGRLLDLGCGDGKLTSILLEAMHFSPSVLVGVDIDQQETAIASSLGLYQKIYTTPANNIPEPDASFDFVFSNSVLEHIPNIHDVLA